MPRFYNILQRLHLIILAASALIFLGKAPGYSSCTFNTNPHPKYHLYLKQPIRKRSYFEKFLANISQNKQTFCPGNKTVLKAPLNQICLKTLPPGFSHF